jgi:spermidine/putrescine-binding protein
MATWTSALCGAVRPPCSGTRTPSSPTCCPRRAPTVLSTCSRSPRSPKNVEAAHSFINYILRPEVSRLISEKFPYTNPNVPARKLLSESQLANPASYPKPSKLEVFRDIGKAASAIDKLVTDLKSGQ